MDLNIVPTIANYVLNTFQFSYQAILLVISSRRYFLTYNGEIKNRVQAAHFLLLIANYCFAVFNMFKMIIPILYLMMCLLNSAALIALFKITQNDNVEDPLRKKFILFTFVIFLWFTVIGMLPVEGLGARCQAFTYQIPFCYLM